jgi:hypothetical protein
MTMPTRSFLRGAVLFAVTLTGFAALAGAQFQAPTDEELKMTSDPKAPGAAAVYLYREETTDDEHQFQTYYVRIKVLTEKGKDLAVVHIPYEHGEVKVTDIMGRVIHSDGTVIPLTAKPEDLVDVKAKHFQVDTMVFTLPSVEVGSILEYRLQFRYKDYLASTPTWDIQQPYFVRKAHYSFLSRGFGLMWSITPRDSNIKVQNDKGRYTVDVSDVPPLPDDDWMPPLNTIRQRVEFYYSFSHGAKEFWDSVGKVDTEYLGKTYLRPSDTLKKAAADMVAPGDTDAQKARKIYAAVMKLDNTDFSREKSQAERKKEKLKDVRNAEDVWKQQSGNGNELALLYVALARAAGLKAWPEIVADRGVIMFDPNYLYGGQLTDYIAIVSIDGKKTYADPAQKDCPFGLLLWTHTLTVGVTFPDSGAVLTQTPADTYENNVIQRIANLSIDAQGNIKGVVRFVMTGLEALRWRQLALENDPDELKKQFNEAMLGAFPDGVQAEFDRFLGLDDYNSMLMGVAKVSGNIGAPTGKYFILPGLFFQSRANHPFVAQDKRTIPVDLHYPLKEKDDVTYELPPGYSVTSSPSTPDLKWSDFAALKIESTTAENTVEVTREYVRNFTLLGPEGYSNLHDFYQKLATADQQQIVLTRTPAAKGN